MIEVYKTHEISEELWEQIAEGFKECFNRDTKADSFKNGFCVRNQWGYGYHAIDFDDETHEIRGFNTFTPTLYDNGLKVLVSGSSFVKEKYRKDVFVFLDMVKALRKKGAEDGFALTVGVPNHNSFQYSLKILKTTFVGYLDYYILPRNVSHCLNKPLLRPFDCLSRLWSWLHVYTMLSISTIWNSEQKMSKYALVTDDEYFKVRFEGDNYLKFKEGRYRAFYRMVDENGNLTAYLMDFRENDKRTKRALAKAVLHILKQSNPDAILFVGFLKLNQHVLLKVPSRFVPKPLPLVSYVINSADKEFYSDICELKNWDFSLMNFDAR